MAGADVGGDGVLELGDPRALGDQGVAEGGGDRSDVGVGELLAAVGKDVAHTTACKDGNIARRSSASSHSVLLSLEYRKPSCTALPAV